MSCEPQASDTHVGRLTIETARAGGVRVAADRLPSTGH
jgi:hypothetical protein